MLHSGPVYALYLHENMCGTLSIVGKIQSHPSHDRPLYQSHIQGWFIPMGSKSLSHQSIKSESESKLKKILNTINTCKMHMAFKAK